MEESGIGEERDLWELWTRATSLSQRFVADELATKARLSMQDFTVLERLVGATEGALRQYVLARELDYEPSRLSHHLRRMQQRGLVRRARGAGGVTVVLTRAGQLAYRRAAPVYRQATERALSGALSPGARRALRAICERVARVDGGPVRVARAPLGQVSSN